MSHLNRRQFLKGVSAGAAGVLAGRLVGPPRARAAEDATDPSPPNIIFILADDLGWADTGCYGSTFHQTPHIDKLADAGMRFTNAYAACCVCSPTRASILTGKYPARLHLTDWIPGHGRRNARLRVPDWNKKLDLDEVTLAEALKKAGYRTASIGKWHLGGKPVWPEKQGFDHTVCNGRGSPRSYFAPYRSPKPLPGPKGEYLTDRLSEEACNFIEANRDRPFFLYLPHHAVHTPIRARQELIAGYKARLAELPAGKGPRRQRNPVYAAMIHSVDEGVGRIVAKLDELKLDERTIVVLFSDNGGLVGPTSNAPLRAGKGTLYEGGVREPCIVRFPGVVAPGTTCDTPVISNDFFPTLLALAGASEKAPPAPDGVSLLPLLKRSGTIRREAIYWHYPHYHRSRPAGAVRAGHFKLIEHYETRRCELYNLAEDLGETNDLAEKMPQKADELKKMLADWRKRVDAQMPVPNPDYKPRAPK